MHLNDALLNLLKSMLRSTSLNNFYPILNIQRSITLLNFIIRNLFQVLKYLNYTLYKEWQRVCMSPQAVKAPIYNTATVYVNMVMLSMRGESVFFSLSRSCLWTWRTWALNKLKNCCWSGRNGAFDKQRTQVGLLSFTGAPGRKTLSVAPTEAIGKRAVKSQAQLSVLWAACEHLVTLIFHVVLLP